MKIYFKTLILMMVWQLSSACAQIKIKDLDQDIPANVLEIYNQKKATAIDNAESGLPLFTNYYKGSVSKIENEFIVKRRTLTPLALVSRDERATFGKDGNARYYSINEAYLLGTLFQKEIKKPYDSEGNKLLLNKNNVLLGLLYHDDRREFFQAKTKYIVTNKNMLLTLLFSQQDVLKFNQEGQTSSTDKRFLLGAFGFGESNGKKYIRILYGSPS